MGRPKTPKAKAQLTGAADKNPQRYRGDAPLNDNPVGEAPAHLDAGATLAWNEIRDISMAGVLTESDRISLEMAAALLSEHRKDPAEFPSAKLTNLRGLLGSFGMNPSDRQKLAVDKGEHDDGWDNL